MKYYILNGHKAVSVKDVLTWARWFKTADRRIALTTVRSGVEVSTVFLGIDHNFNDGSPLLFETMVFGGKLDQEMDRYSTWTEAEDGHNRMVEKVTKEDV